MAQRLPPVSNSHGVWQFPLAEGTARDLMAAALADSRNQATVLLVNTFGEDPSLTLWALCCARPAEPWGLTQLANWLLDEGLDRHLHWPASPEHTTDTDHAAPHAAWQRWAQLAAEACWLSARVQPYLSQLPVEVHEATGLLSLVSGAHAWLMTSRTSGASRSHTETSCLPTWLADWLAQIEPGAACSAAAAATVRRMLEGPQADVTAAEATWLRHQRATVLNRWLASDGSIRRILPRWVQAQATAKQREIEFARRLETEKLIAMKELAAGAGHEINNPLANIASRAQTLLRDETDPDRRKKLMTINQQAFRAHEIIADMMLFARPPKLMRQSVALVPLIAQIMEELAPDAEQQQIALVCQPVEPLPTVHVDPIQLGVAIKAICRNALEAIPAAGRIEIVPAVFAARDAAAPDTVTITISDTGPGIDAAVRPHLFDPFYSGREAGRGVGMGLSKAWRIVHEHGGCLEVGEAPEGGARFIIRIPSLVEPSSRG